MTFMRLLFQHCHILKKNKRAGILVPAERREARQYLVATARGKSAAAANAPFSGNCSGGCFRRRSTSSVPGVARRCSRPPLLGVVAQPMEQLNGEIGGYRGQCLRLG